MKDKRRISDGITVNKIMVTITGTVLSMSIMLVSWVYTTDRKSTLDNIKIITEKVSMMAENQIISRERTVNMDARIIENKNNLMSWRKEVRQYWANK